ncbi:MAG: hypothetical protein IPL96_08775 [Holophagaceae bacterium]|nr:hypothetical protein [Holophagaceae bacterium]
MKPSPTILTAILGSAATVCAQSPAPPAPAAEQLKVLEARIRKLEEELQALKAIRPAPSAEPDQQPRPDETPVRLGGAGGAAGKALNPDLSLIGDFRAAVGHDPVRQEPGLENHEVELGLSAVVDPYSRGDVFLAFGKDGVEVEEAILTFPALPGGFSAKVGKMRAEFGKVNTRHNHTLPWTDRPLVTENLLGGEEGISDMGVSVSRILPAPGNLFLEATVQVFRGNSEGLFTATRKKDLSQVGHLRGYHDLTENTNLEVGLSYARGHNELGSDFTTTLRGADATLRWKPLQRSIYSSLLWRNELVWSQRELLDGTHASKGFYSSLEYRLNQRWTFGARYDRSGRAAEAGLVDRGWSALGTYWMSEFSQLRGQYRSTWYAGGQRAGEFRLQLLFVMGAHGAHPF